MGKPLAIEFVDIAGSGKRPETWATIVTCLNEVGLRYLADIIEAEYSGSGGINDTPGNELSYFCISRWKCSCRVCTAGA